VSTGDSEIIALRATVIGGTLPGAALIRPWLTLHPSGGYLSFTQAGADLFGSSPRLPCRAAMASKRLGELRAAPAIPRR
jgi:hypothetical protein